MFLVALVGLVTLSGTAQAGALDNGWQKNSAAATEIKNYVESISKKKSADYVPPSARVAVFDLDGTVFCDTFPRPFDWLMLVDFVNERGIRLPLAARSTAKEITDTYYREMPDDISEQVATAAAEAYRGMTAEELTQRVNALKNSTARGFSGMTMGEAFYKPMVELIAYLQENDFTVYVVGDTERTAARALAADKLGIPSDRIIGTDFGVMGTGQQAQAADNYSLRATDKVVFDGTVSARNVKMNKVTAIMREIGKRPVLAFGNDLSDSSMLTFVATNNPYKSLAFMVVNDDEAREHSDESEAEEIRQASTFNGWKVISMKKDFATIYGKDVKKVNNRS